jgi:hypothetical protein
MNNDQIVVFIHDVASGLFLIPFSSLCIAEVFFGYVINPMFLTHALFCHLLYDTLWLYCLPQATHLSGLVMLHHTVAMSMLMYPLFTPEAAPLTALAGLVEVDTSILILRRLFRNSMSLDILYRVSNLVIRVFYETMMLLFVAQLFREEPLLFRMHMVGSQMFITTFSYGICAMTFSKKPRKRIKSN